MKMWCDFIFFLNWLTSVISCAKIMNYFIRNNSNWNIFYEWFKKEKNWQYPYNCQGLVVLDFHIIFWFNSNILPPKGLISSSLEPLPMWRIQVTLTWISGQKEWTITSLRWLPSRTCPVCPGRSTPISPIYRTTSTSLIKWQYSM